MGDVPAGPGLLEDVAVNSTLKARGGGIGIALIVGALAWYGLDYALGEDKACRATVESVTFHAAYTSYYSYECGDSKHPRSCTGSTYHPEHWTVELDTPEGEQIFDSATTIDFQRGAPVTATLRWGRWTHRVRGVSRLDPVQVTRW